MKPRWKGFHSPLAEPIRKFLEHKRALCKKYHSEEDVLRLLDAYLVDAEVVNIEQITAQVLDKFLASRPASRPSTYNYLVGVLRRLFEWMVSQEMLAVSLLQDKRRRATDDLKPYIFSHDQVKWLLVMARQLPDTSNAYRRGRKYQMIFALAYGLGLRVGEISRLQVGDIDFEQAVMIIKQSKFGKTRIVPLGPSLAQQLKEFLVESGKPENLSTPVFSARGDNRPLATVTITVVFHQLILKMGLKAATGEREPRLHDLRHSFAVNTLLRWYREGSNPSEHLPQLCTFLGHSRLSSTAVYLTITGSLLDEANDRFHRFATSALREVAP
jgi:integrase